jgi:hypothetical protein
MSHVSLYSSQLLNELHELFPELLYRPERFHTVQDVLYYIIHVANRNPYSSGNREYTQSIRPAYIRNLVLHRNPSTRTPFQDRYGIHEIMEQRRERRRQQAQQAQQTHQEEQTQQQEQQEQQEQHEQQEQQEQQEQEQQEQQAQQAESSSESVVNANNTSTEQLLTSLFSGLLNIPSSSLTLSSSSVFRNGLMRIPTPEQIQANTDYFVAVSNIDDNCAICQDPMLEEQILRMIYACGHVYHTVCLERAFTISGRCPNCRYDITAPL